MNPTAITRTTCWSARQCFERATALDKASDGVIQQLDQLERDLGMDLEGFGRCSEHQAAITHIGALVELVEHLVVNMKSGFALPPTPTATERPPTVPGTHQRPVEQPPSYKPPAAAAVAAQRPPAPPKPARSKPQPKAKPFKPDGRKRPTANGRADVLAQARSQGLLAHADMLAALSMTKGGLHRARKEGRVPQPHAYRGGMPFWKPEQLAACTTRGHERKAA